MNLLRMIVRIKMKIKILYKQNQFDKGAVVGEKTRFGQMARCINHAGKKEQLWIGKKCDIDSVITVHKEGKIKIGDCTTIRYDSVIGSVESVYIGSHVIISNNVHIYDNNNHPISPQIRWEMCENGFYGSMWQWDCSEHAPIVIEDNVWIGERATILKGVRIGRGSIVGCDAVVTHDIPPYCVAAGNPAKVVKKLRDKSNENI